MKNKYSAQLIECSEKLDNSLDFDSDFLGLVTKIISSQDVSATKLLVLQLSEIVKFEEASISAKKLCSELKDILVRFYGHIHIVDICKHEEKEEDTRTLDELLEELNCLIGLVDVKEKVNNLIAFQKIQKLRQDNGLKSQKNTLHLAFTGNPGTGKTTVARIVGRVYKQIGLLSKGHFIEASRTDLIAGYQGQTALKVKSLIERAKGGVLFIDEAYSITENDHSDSYGRECLTELTKALEDYRDDLVVIVAGYTEPMKHFFESNPGLKSRFNTFIEFPDYSADELQKMLIKLCDDNNYTLNDDALNEACNYFKTSIENKSDNFANGRLVRNLFDELIMAHAKRVVILKNPSQEELVTIVKNDFEISEKR